jgi:hypothetical protein
MPQFFCLSLRILSRDFGVLGCSMAVSPLKGSLALVRGGDLSAAGY